MFVLQLSVIIKSIYFVMLIVGLHNSSKYCEKLQYGQVNIQNAEAIIGIKVKGVIKYN